MPNTFNPAVIPNQQVSPSTATPFMPAAIPTAVPPMAQSTSPQQQIIDAAAGPKCNLIWAKSLDQILAHPTSPNEQLYFGSETDQVIYVRETDAKGNVKNPIKVLHYTVEEMPFGPEAQFVTKDEHKQLYSLVEKLAANVDSMNGKLEKLLNG